MMPDDEHPGFGLIMPFVIYDEQGEAFAAGWECGQLDALLPVVRGLGATIERYVTPAVVPQLDLIAMRHGYTLSTEPWDEHPDEWVLATFSVASIESPS